MANPSTVTKVLDATASLVFEKGFDNISVSEIILRSGVSRRTFYSHFESVGAVASEFWLVHGEDWVSTLESREVEALESELDGVLLELVSISHRVPELFEVIAPSFSQRWAIAESDPQAFIRWLWKCALSLGGRAEIHAGIATSMSALMVFSSIIDAFHAGNKSNRDSYEEAFALHQQLTIHTGDETTDKILLAAVEVVGRAGLAHTTMLRICRRARISAGAVGGRFSTPLTIVTSAFNQVIEFVVNENVTKFPNSGKDDLWRRYSESIVAALSDSRLPWRLFRREMLIASRHNAVIQNRVKQGFLRTDEFLKKSLLDFGMNEFAVSACAEFNRYLTEGIAILKDFDLPVEKVNHGEISKFVISQAPTMLAKSTLN